MSKKELFRLGKDSVRGLTHTKYAGLHVIKAIRAFHGKGAVQVGPRRFAAKMNVIQNLLAIGDPFRWWIASMRRGRVSVRHGEKANVGDQPLVRGQPAYGKSSLQTAHDVLSFILFCILETGGGISEGKRRRQTA